MTKRIGCTFLFVALPAAGLAQEVPSGLTAQFANTPELAQQLAEDRQYLANTLQETRNAVIALTAIDEDSLAPGYPQMGGGFSERLSELSEAQSQFIEDYADTMALRTESLFEFWQDANDGRAVTFFQTGSLFPVSVTDPDIGTPEEPANPIDVPGEFPGIEPPVVGGFFAEVAN